MSSLLYTLYYYHRVAIKYYQELVTHVQIMMECPLFQFLLYVKSEHIFYLL